MLMASRLDLELLGSDASALWLLDRAAEGLNQIASQLDAAAAALRVAPCPLRLRMMMPIAGSNHAPLATDDARARVLPLIASRSARARGRCGTHPCPAARRARGSATVARTAAPIRCAGRLAASGLAGPMDGTLAGTAPRLARGLGAGQRLLHRTGSALGVASALAGAGRCRGAARQPRPDPCAAQRPRARHLVRLRAGGGAGACRVGGPVDSGLPAGRGHGPRLCTAALLGDGHRRHRDGLAAGAPGQPRRRPGHR